MKGTRLWFIEAIVHHGKNVWVHLFLILQPQKLSSHSLCGIGICRIVKGEDLKFPPFATTTTCISTCTIKRILPVRCFVLVKKYDETCKINLRSTCCYHNVWVKSPKCNNKLCTSNMRQVCH